MGKLVDMGFDAAQARQALIKAKNDIEAAITLIFDSSASLSTSSHVCPPRRPSNKGQLALLLSARCACMST